MLPRRYRGHALAVMLILLCCTLLPMPASTYLFADPGAALMASSSLPENEETRRLLEKTLSSSEIEREITRITSDQQALKKKVALLNKQAAEKKTAIADQQERAGAIIRSYYMGDRDGLLEALLSAKSISRVLALYDYYEIIIGRDREVLSQYEEQYKDMKATLKAAERSSKELNELRMALEEQQVRVNALNKEIESGVRNSSDPDSMTALLKEFSLYWENIGVHEVKIYFKALSSAMKNLPQFVQNREDVLARKGMSYHLNLKEEDLNQFLQSQNKIFKDFAFHFKDDVVTASGKSGKLSLTLTGHYTIQQQPVNALMFHVDHVVFNGLELPGTTRKSLEEEFDLGFYPEKIVSFLKATAVESKEGVLHVKLSISF